MNQPSLDKLMKKVDSRYTLVVLAAKRARLLTDIEESENGSKPVIKALQDIANDKIRYQRTGKGKE
jgi:DNA-directed RNA polymerase subunit omega